MPATGIVILENYVDMGSFTGLLLSDTKRFSGLMKDSLAFTSYYWHWPYRYIMIYNYLSKV